MGYGEATRTRMKVMGFFCFVLFFNHLQIVAFTLETKNSHLNKFYRFFFMFLISSFFKK